MDEPVPPGEPQRSCAISGEQRPESQMVRLGGHFVCPEHKDAAVQLLQQGTELETPLAAGSDLAPPEFWPLLAKAWESFLRHAPVLVLLDLSVSLPASLLHHFMEDAVFSNADILASLSYSLVVPTMFSAVSMALVLAVLAGAAGGRRMGFMDAWNEVLRRLGGIIGSTMASTLLILAGMVLCLLPGLVVMVRLTFSLCALMAEGVGAVPSLWRSVELTEGCFWKVLGFVLAVAAVTLAPLIAFSILTEFLPQSWRRWELIGSAEAIVSLPLVFLNVFTFVYYRALAARSGLQPS